MSVDVNKIKKILYKPNLNIKSQIKLLKNDYKIFRNEILKY